MRYALINSETLIVENVILWDGKAPIVFEGYRLVQSAIAEMGDVFNSETLGFTKNTVPADQGTPS